MVLVKRLSRDKLKTEKNLQYLDIQSWAIIIWILSKFYF